MDDGCDDDVTVDVEALVLNDERLCEWRLLLNVDVRESDVATLPLEAPPSPTPPTPITLALLEPIVAAVVIPDGFKMKGCILW